MRLAEIATALLGLNASFGLAVKIHPDQKPGIYIGSREDEHGLNHTRIGDVHAASRILRSMKDPSMEARDLPGFGRHINCWEGGSLESNAVLNLRTNLGRLCDSKYGSWVHPYSTVYATDGTFAAFFCDYGEKATYCTSKGMLTGGQAVDHKCGGGPGEDYTRVHVGPNWSYGNTFAERHFCTTEGHYLDQQQGQISD